MNRFPRRPSATTGIGLKGPFEDYPTEDDETKRLNEFLRRTGLNDYERIFRIGAFLARRDPGVDQVAYVRKIREAERAITNNPGKGSTLEDPQDGPFETIENKRIREDEEDRILGREGYNTSWFRLHIFFRQNRRVIALVGCCSLGAIIQGWDETAINGGGFGIA